eukprot:scaffold12650_cov118-Isochrysis_galbana.AAC.2
MLALVLAAMPAGIHAENRRLLFASTPVDYGGFLNGSSSACLDSDWVKANPPPTSQCGEFCGELPKLAGECANFPVYDMLSPAAQRELQTAKDAAQTAADDLEHKKTIASIIAITGKALSAMGTVAVFPPLNALGGITVGASSAYSFFSGISDQTAAECTDNICAWDKVYGYTKMLVEDQSDLDKKENLIVLFKGTKAAVDEKLGLLEAFKGTADTVNAAMAELEEKYGERLRADKALSAEEQAEVESILGRGDPGLNGFELATLDSIYDDLSGYVDDMIRDGGVFLREADQRAARTMIGVLPLYATMHLNLEFLLLVRHFSKTRYALACISRGLEPDECGPSQLNSDPADAACAAVWGAVASGSDGVVASCGDRITWLQSYNGGLLSEADARAQVAAEFPGVCGGCAAGPAALLALVNGTAGGNKTEVVFNMKVDNFRRRVAAYSDYATSMVNTLQSARLRQLACGSQIVSKGSGSLSKGSACRVDFTCSDTPSERCGNDYSWSETSTVQRRWVFTTQAPFGQSTAPLNLWWCECDLLPNQFSPSPCDSQSPPAGWDDCGDWRKRFIEYNQDKTWDELVFAPMRGWQALATTAGGMRTQPVPCAPGEGGDGGRCTQCAPGTAKPTTGNQACTPCALGTYASTKGAIQCTSCPQASLTTTAGVGSTSVEQCLCTDPAADEARQRENFYACLLARQWGVQCSPSTFGTCPQA